MAQGGTVEQLLAVAPTATPGDIPVTVATTRTTALPGDISYFLSETSPPSQALTG